MLYKARLQHRPSGTNIPSLTARSSRLLAALCGVGLLLSSPAVGAPPAQIIELQPPGGSLRAQIAPERGGGLVGLEYRHKGNWLELLYRGMDFAPGGDWDGKAPILWPAVGRNFVASAEGGDLKAGWTVGGVFYPITIHGFARDLPWTVVSQSAGGERASLKLALTDSERTRVSYPFGFKLTSEYAVEGNVLTIFQRVEAASDNNGPMPFSIGNHLTFNNPLVGQSGGMTFQTPATIQLLLDPLGRPNGKVIPFSAVTPRPLTDLGVRKSTSLSGFGAGTAWIRLLDPSGLIVEVSHQESLRPPGMPVLFNLWADSGRGFVSPEPWVGKQNSLATGDGVVSLPPGTNFEWTITVKLE